MNNVSCKNCLYFQGVLRNGTVEPEGFCKLNPPVLFSDKSQGRPKVHMNDWCGEFVHMEEGFDPFFYDDNSEDDDYLFER